MRLKAIIKMKCPHCLQGAIFSKPFRMNPDCAHCGIHYERERGYFMMAVFVGYVMSFFIAIPVLVLMYLTMQPTMTEYVIGAVTAVVLAIPLIFHYARVVWLHLDELMDPRKVARP